jgi:hypothetical protein
VRIPVSFFARAGDAVPRSGELAYPDDFDAFLEVAVDPARLADKAYLRAAKDVRLWSPATFAGRREAAAVTSVCALVLDYDTDDGDPADIAEVWGEYDHVLHSTFTPGRYRIVIPYARPVTPAEHNAVWAWAFARDNRVDGSCKDASRAYYVPTFRVTGDAALDGEPVFGYNKGERLDVARLPVDLRAVPPSRSPSAKSNAPPTTGTNPGAGGAADSPYAGIERAGEVQQREDLALIESRCAFMRHARADAATLAEPSWYAALSIVARCRGGDDLAHELSRPYAGYSEAETTDKYERTKHVGPATCAHIRTVAPAACKGCPLQVTSPVMLGRQPAAAEEPADPRALLAEAEAAHDTARVHEDAAMVAVEQTKRALRAMRSRTSVASEEDLVAAVRALNDAQDAHRLAQRIRSATEKGVAKARARASLTGLPPGADPVVWSRLHVVKDRPTGSVGNVLAVLDGDPAWSSRLAYDTFSLDVCLDRQPLPEEKATEVTAKLSYDYGMDTSTLVVMECIRAAARKRHYHPVREWLDGLVWDGVPRVRDLLLTGFGAEPAGDEELVRLIGEKFLLSMLARAYTPGAKVDTMLVLAGKQGAFKTTALETLAGPGWFGNTKLDLATKDSFMQMRGKWLYEIGEMEGVKQVEARTSKHWLSSRIDSYRAPYARRSEDHPRQTVMAGTTNEDEFLMDPTGYRRYWPVRVRLAALAWVRANRTQLFAEAVVLYRAGHTWWFDEESPEAARLRRYAMPYQQVHPWSEVIYEWVLQRKNDAPFTAVEVLRLAFGRMTGDLSQSEATIVGSILRNTLGCPGERRDVDGKRVTQYRRPATMPPVPPPGGRVVGTISPATNVYGKP